MNKPIKNGTARGALTEGGQAAQTDPGVGPEWGGGSVIDRRSGLDRREIADRLGREGSKTEDRVHSEARAGTGLERRRGPGRRRTDFTKSAEEGEMTTEQFLFIMAVESFKKANGKMFPTWTDVLEVIRKLGYRKTMHSELNIRGAEDWREAADAPAGVHAKPGHPEDEWRREAA
ncbi:MAG: hypothetical protein ACK4WH_07075 [Phycisphaerales bacterium]